jgi:DNA processing protein
MTPEEVIENLRLHLATLYKAGLALRLIDAFGNAGSVLGADIGKLLAVEGMSPGVKKRLRCGKTKTQAEEEWRKCVSEGIRILIHPASSWPTALRSLPEMPLVLFSKGELEPGDSKALGIVGSRRPTPYSRTQADRFASDLAGMGATIVSGLARGIDTRAHISALESGGRTLAVLGSGLGRIYPRENRALAEKILGDGAVLSEFPFSMGPRTFHFPQRNRLISGLSTTLLVIEAGRKSGSLITARWALEQGKNIFVLPSRVDDEHNRGGLHLLRDGAGAAISPRDLLLELEIAQPPRQRGEKNEPAPRPFPGELGGPLEALFKEEDGWHPDALSARLGVPCGPLLAALGRLEMDGYILKTPSGFYRTS